MKKWLIPGLAVCGLGVGGVLVVNHYSGPSSQSAAAPSVIQDQHATAVTVGRDKFQDDAAALEAAERKAAGE
ncbi:hypothetical protein [Gluconobacter cerinus]|uniref:hypothetical protein n=1 Tax=Gluconobacter cerinus TaxID=38307 RepID=UPI001B8B6762|nr:hypothetical protein [Gluconobacter cerinus]MBS0984264.1 hypothetical protein [Gluconobacter cerinus]